jgi:hypothetical protein
VLEFCEFLQRADSWVPLVYQDSGLSGYPRHYLRVGDLPIIASHSFIRFSYLFCASTYYIVELVFVLSYI